MFFQVPKLHVPNFVDKESEKSEKSSWILKQKIAYQRPNFPCSEVGKKSDKIELGHRMIDFPLLQSIATDQHNTDYRRAAILIKCQLNN